RGKKRRASEEAHHLRRRIPERAVGQYADELALLQAVVDTQHRLEASERDDLGCAAGTGGPEEGGDAAGVVLVHRHRHREARAAPADGAHELEASEVRADEKRSATARESLLHERLAFDRDVEQLVASAHEVKTIENGRGEGEQLAKALTGGGLVAEHAARMLAGAPARAGGEGEEIRGDEVEHAPPVSAFARCSPSPRPFSIVFTSCALATSCSTSRSK